jgi:hypothetical protein
MLCPYTSVGHAIDAAIFPTNFECAGQTPNGTVSQATVESAASKVIIMEKGANYSSWGYPWFHP